MLGFGVRHDRKTFSSSNPIKIDELKIVEWEEGHDIPGFSTSVLSPRPYVPANITVFSATGGCQKYYVS